MPPDIFKKFLQEFIHEFLQISTVVLSPGFLKELSQEFLQEFLQEELLITSVFFSLHSITSGIFLETSLGTPSIIYPGILPEAFPEIHPDGFLQGVF